MCPFNTGAPACKNTANSEIFLFTKEHNSKTIPKFLISWSVFGGDKHCVELSKHLAN